MADTLILTQLLPKVGFKFRHGGNMVTNRHDYDFHVQKTMRNTGYRWNRFVVNSLMKTVFEVATVTVYATYVPEPDESALVSVFNVIKITQRATAWGVDMKPFVFVQLILGMRAARRTWRKTEQAVLPPRSWAEGLAKAVDAFDKALSKKGWDTEEMIRAVKRYLDDNGTNSTDNIDNTSGDSDNVNVISDNGNGAINQQGNVDQDSTGDQGDKADQSGTSGSIGVNGNITGNDGGNGSDGDDVNDNIAGNDINANITGNDVNANITASDINANITGNGATDQDDDGDDDAEEKAYVSKISPADEQELCDALESVDLADQEEEEQVELTKAEMRGERGRKNGTRHQAMKLAKLFCAQVVEEDEDDVVISWVRRPRRPHRYNQRLESS